MAAQESASTLQLLGAGGLGAVIGWYVYYLNRYRGGEVKLSDAVTLIGILGGSAITALFPAGTDLFGAFGVGVFAGFFSYYIALLALVGRSPNFTSDWFLDGRRKDPEKGVSIPAATRAAGSAMGGDAQKPHGD